MLSVSRSFCARVPDLGRYRITSGLRLPRFGPSDKRVPATPQLTQPELPMTGVAKIGVAGGEMSGGERLDRGPTARGELRRRWVARLRRCWDWLFRPTAPRRPSRRPVQTAFLLESVKVVRNDLMDADLELVRMKKRRRAGLDQGASGSSRGGGMRPGLGRTAVRWLTAGRMS
jgi:hypothetical protein